jgi:hypothetical protein
MTSALAYKAAVFESDKHPSLVLCSTNDSIKVLSNWSQLKDSEMCLNATDIQTKIAVNTSTLIRYLRNKTFFIVTDSTVGLFHKTFYVLNGKEATVNRSLEW